MTAKYRVLLLVVFGACIAASSYMSMKPYLVGNPLIGHGDQANIANLARSFVEGRGLVVDNVWLHIDGGVPGNQVTHPEIYWSIYAALAISPFFFLFGANVVSMLIPALISQALITALTAFWVWRLTKEPLPTIAAMVFVSFAPIMLAGVSGLSDIYLTLGVLVVGSLLAAAITRGSWWLFALAGLITGLSIGIKPSGLLLLGVWAPYLVLMPGRRRIVVYGLVFAAGVAAALAPYVAYNYKNFGTAIQPGIPLVNRAMEVRHYYYWIKGEKDGLSRTTYAPVGNEEVPRGDLSLLLKRSRDHFESFVGQVLIEGSVCPMWLTPFVFAGLFALLWPLPQRRELSRDSAKLLMYFGLLMFGAGLVLAIRQHFEARYWNFLFPFCVIVAIPWLQRLPKMTYVALMAIAVASGFMWAKKFAVLQVPPEYETAERLLPKGCVVLTAAPWQFAFHTRIPSVATPYTSDPLVLKGMAERYGADYLVLLGDGRHEMHSRLEKGEMQVDFLEPFHSEDRMKIFHIKRSPADGSQGSN